MNKIEVVKPPKIFTDRSKLKDEMCYIIEPYDHMDIISACLYKEKDGYIVKLLDKSCKEIHPDKVGPIGDTLMGVLNVCLYSKVKESQFFFATDDKECMLIDIFDSKNFLSAGMIKDLFEKRIKTQNIIDIKRFDQDISNCIVKPVIVKYEGKNPIYLRV